MNIYGAPDEYLHNLIYLHSIRYIDFHLPQLGKMTEIPYIC